MPERRKCMRDKIELATAVINLLTAIIALVAVIMANS